MLALGIGIGIPLAQSVSDGGSPGAVWEWEAGITMEWETGISIATE